MHSIKVNFDGGVVREDNIAACGFMVKNFTGVILAAGYVPLFTSNVIKAKLQGLWGVYIVGERV